MKIDEIRKKTIEEINKDIKNLKEELFRLRFRKVTEEINKPNVIHDIRKDIARLETILRENEIKNLVAGGSVKVEEKKSVKEETVSKTQSKKGK
ncbi:MAG: 50S ribosomal protein L29 [Planctomycetes bacterium]|nr:50S ribosomal protein L29 [Planctomycetota bacterium]